MGLFILRCAFFLVAIGVAVSLLGKGLVPTNPAWIEPIVIIGGIVALVGGTILVDHWIPRKKIDAISSVFIGLLVGVLLTYIIGLVLTPALANNPNADAIRNIIGMIVCYICVSVLMQTKDDFRFIIPYVEFAKEVKGLRPYIIDTSAVIDGRIADVVETRILDNQLIMPRFVLNELQGIADSSDKLRRSRGRRGLDILNRLRNDEDVDLQIFDRESPDMASQPVDMKLVLLAKEMEGKLITGDYNLNKVARLHNVPVINLNDLANAMKPVFLPGENTQVKIVKAGEEDSQGVGYLDDGTMIVVEGGRPHIGKAVRISVTSVLQTSAGRMIFGRYEGQVTKQPANQTKEAG